MADRNIVNIIGAGLSGLSAAGTFAEGGWKVRLISVQPSERAQSNLAEGGINAALDVMGENDSTDEHFADTMKGGVDLADPEMVRGLVEAAPEIVRDMENLGVPFHREGGHIIERNFGGQKKKRTAYAMSSTGKVLTVALIDRVRKFEASEMVERYCHHIFERLLTDGAGEELCCHGVQVRDLYTQEEMIFEGPVLMACGGLNGFFTGRTTGTTANTGTAAAQLFSQGVRMANLEFLQYHPTTVEITGKRMLISEAARGEGGRLFVETDGGRNYFMEEKFGEGGNLMPRDAISREMAKIGKQAYLDLTGLPESTWKERLMDLREEIIHYMDTDPATEPVPVSPGIHYFMGGILADVKHRTNVRSLYASGECACAYHGANRLGGNSLLGAIYGGRTAARNMMRDAACGRDFRKNAADDRGNPFGIRPYSFMTEEEKDAEARMERILIEGLGVLRDERSLNAALESLTALKNEAAKTSCSDELSARLLLSEGMLRAAIERRESRGAHTRLDYPDRDDAYQKTTAVDCDGGAVQVSFRDTGMNSKRL